MVHIIINFIVHYVLPVTEEACTHIQHKTEIHSGGHQQINRVRHSYKQLGFARCFPNVSINLQLYTWPTEKDMKWGILIFQVKILHHESSICFVSSAIKSWLNLRLQHQYRADHISQYAFTALLFCQRLHPGDFMTTQ